MRMADIFPEHIREWIAWMQPRAGSPIRPCRNSTSAFCHAWFAARSLVKVPADRIEPRRSR
jgi:hypothetical protein